MIVATADIPYSYGDVIKIKPIFDVHFGNKHCKVNAFREFIQDTDDKTYFFGGGDLIDSIIVPDKRYAKHADATESDAIIDEQIQGVYDILAPVKDRIIGLGKGNHEDVIVRKCGTDPIARLCQKLECQHLGLSGIIRVKMRSEHGRGRMIIIRWHHGWGGGSRTQGADLTKYSKDTMHWDADVFLYGHVHRKQSDRVPRVGLVGEKLVSKPKLLGICGTFLKTYSSGIDTTYSELKGYPPVEIGGITVNIRPDHKWVRMWIDV